MPALPDVPPPETRALGAETDARGAESVRAYSLIAAPWLWTIGLVGVVVGALLNESYNPTVFGRYSPEWFCVLVAACGVLAVVAVVALKRTLAAPAAVAPLSPERRLTLLLVALAAAAWGTSLLTQYPVDPYHLRRPFVGEFFGATQRPGVLLEYVAQLALGLAVVLILLRHARHAAEGRRSTVTNALLLLASVVMVYLLGEGAARAVHIVWLQPQGEPTKSTRMWHVTFGKLNRFGYRDGDFQPRQSPAELRVLVVGDSFTYGTGVADPADRFTEVLARDLAETRRFAAVRVFNAGVPGAHSVDELGHLRSLLWLRPDLVILAYVFNDIDHVNPLPLGDTPFGAPTFGSRFRPHRLLMLNSHLWDELLLRYRRAALFGPRRPRLDHYFRAYADPVLLARHLDVVAEIADTAAKAGAVFRLAPVQLDFRRHGERMDERVIDAMRERGITVWRHEGLLATDRPVEFQVSAWDGHPNERAHGRIGHFLAERVLATIRPPASSAQGAPPGRGGL